MTTTHWFEIEAKKIFGACGAAYRVGLVCKVGYTSRFGFHLRGTAATEDAALNAARQGRLPDDPAPANQSWVPGSLADPFTPYRPAQAMETAHV